MPLFPHAALILEPGVIFVQSHISCAEAQNHTGLSRGSEYPRKSLTFVERHWSPLSA